MWRHAAITLAAITLVVALTGPFAVMAAPRQVQGAQSIATSQQRIVVPSPILTLDWERLYQNSLWGKRVDGEIRAVSADLRAENDRITNQLEAEERALTKRRPKMTPADFQVAADAFDKRASAIRAAQNAKAEAIQHRLTEERQAFVKAVMPLLDDEIKARGAVVVLDSRMIIRGLAQADMTTELDARVNKEIGDGAGRVPPAAPQGAVSAGDTGISAPPAPGASGTRPPPAWSGSGKVYVDDSANMKAGTGHDPARIWGMPPQPQIPPKRLQRDTDTGQ